MHTDILHSGRVRNLTAALLNSSAPITIITQFFLCDVAWPEMNSEMPRVQKLNYQNIYTTRDVHICFQATCSGQVIFARVTCPDKIVTCSNMKLNLPRC